MNSKKFDVLVVGELNVDLILGGMDVLPELGKEILADKMSLVLGSSSAIFASNLSALGAKVAFIGKIGKDNFGDLVLSSLNNKKVDTSMITECTQSKTGLTVVMSYENSRANVTYPGAMELLCIDEVKDEWLMQAKHLHFSSIFLQPQIKKDLNKLFKKAKSFGLTTSLDPQWDPAEKWDINIHELLPYVDFFMPNIEELYSITKKRNFDASINTFKQFNNLIVKMGTEGANLISKDKRFFQKAYFNSEVVDTVGAGDSFNAGFIYKFLNDACYEECMNFGALIGAASTTATGGTAAFEDINHTIQVIRNKFEKDFKL